MECADRQAASECNGPLHIRNRMDIDHTEYDAVMQKYDSNLDEDSGAVINLRFGVLRCFMESRLDYVFCLLHVPCSIYDVIIYPMILGVDLGGHYKDYQSAIQFMI